MTCASSSNKGDIFFWQRRAYEAIDGLPEGFGSEDLRSLRKSVADWYFGGDGYVDRDATYPSPEITEAIRQLEHYT